MREAGIIGTHISVCLAVYAGCMHAVLLCVCGRAHDVIVWLVGLMSQTAHSLATAHNF